MWGVCLRLLVKNMKGNDSDICWYSLTRQLFNHLLQPLVLCFLWMFLIFNFDTKLNDWRGYCSGRDVALFDWKTHGDSPNHLVYRCSMAITAAHDAAVTHCFCFPLSSCECVNESLWWNVFWSSAVVVCNPVCFFNTVMFKGVMNSHLTLVFPSFVNDS